MTRPFRTPRRTSSRTIAKRAAPVIATAAVTLVAAPAARAADSVFWTNSYTGTMSFAHLDGSGGDQLGNAGPGPEGVAIDAAAGRIYWAARADVIRSARLDGTDPRPVNTTGAIVSSPQGVAIDAAAGRIYWANEGNNTISYARLDGSGGDQLNIAGATANSPEGVAIDAAAGRIYWANWAGNSISFARLDGGGSGPLNITGATTSRPWGVAIDAAAGRIYWANLGNSLGSGKISYARLDGSGGGDQLNLTGAPAFLALLRAPAGTGVPVVSGATTQGSSLSCTQGGWAPDPSGAFLSRAPQSYGYQWSVNGGDIPGATSDSVTAATAGDYRCRVTAANHAGQTAQTSAAHAVTPPPPPPPPTAVALTRRAAVAAAAKPRPRLVVLPTTRRGRRVVRVAVRGELVAPQSVPAARACVGSVRLTVKRGAKVVASGTATLRHDCSFAIRANASRSRIKARRRLPYTVRFSGNDALAPATKSGVLRLAS